MMKVISIFTIIANLFGCKIPEEKYFMLDGPGMVYVDSEHRTEYANELSFDEQEDFPLWAVAYLGKGAEGSDAAKEYIERLFAGLSEEKRSAIRHYDYGGEKWYLVIPRYGDENKLVKSKDQEHFQYIDGSIPYTINCNADVEIRLHIYGGHTVVLDTDENDRLIHTYEIWDITEYKE